MYVLPAIHALTGCDAASKVGTKSRAAREGRDCYHLLYAIGRDELSDEMTGDAEKFLLKCVTVHDADTSDKLCFIVYHENIWSWTLNAFLQLLITSDNIY